MIEISREWKETYDMVRRAQANASGNRPAVKLADFALNLLATVLELEFRLKPTCTVHDHSFGIIHRCPADFTRIDWIVEAKRRLEE